ncbi:SpoVG family protein [bacterium]|jgi:stage V sporulation protein G|nr:SpoVG family protein [bacterium]
MKVSEVRLNLINSTTAVKAIGSFSLDDAFAVRGVRVMEDKNGKNFVAFPSREKQDGSYEDIAFPLSKELYADITGAILKEYQQMVEKQTQEQSQEQTQTEGEKETKAAPKKGKSR